MKIKTENRDYVRDIHSKALLAVNRTKAQDYEFKRNLIKENNNLKEEITDMQNQLSAIREKLGL